MSLSLFAIWNCHCCIIIIWSRLSYMCMLTKSVLKQGVLSLIHGKNYLVALGGDELNFFSSVFFSNYLNHVLSKIPALVTAKKSLPHEWKIYPCSTKKSIRDRPAILNSFGPKSAPNTKISSLPNLGNTWYFREYTWHFTVRTPRLHTRVKSASFFRLSKPFTKHNITSPGYSHDLVMHSDKNIFNSSYIWNIYHVWTKDKRPL